MILYRESKRKMSTSNCAVIHTDGELRAEVLETTTSRASSNEMIHDEHDNASVSSEREIETLPQCASTLKDNSHEHEKVTVSILLQYDDSTANQQLKLHVLELCEVADRRRDGACARTCEFCVCLVQHTHR